MQMMNRTPTIDEIRNLRPDIRLKPIIYTTISSEIGLVHGTLHVDGHIRPIERDDKVVWQLKSLLMQEMMRNIQISKEALDSLQS